MSKAIVRIQAVNRITYQSQEPYVSYVPQKEERLSIAIDT